MKIVDGDEYLDINPKDIGELEAAMLFKAEHIHAHADPELFVAVADALNELFEECLRNAE